MGRSRDRSRSRSMSSSSSGRAAHSTNWDGEGGYRVHVSDLTVGVSRKEVERMFAKFGPINEVWVATNPPCFAFVNFMHRSDGEQAIKELDGKVIGSSRVGLSWARKRNYGGRRGGYRPYSGGPPRRSPSPYRSYSSRTTRTSRYGYSPKRYMSRSRSRSNSRDRHRRRSRTRSRDRRSSSRQRYSTKRIKTSQTHRSNNRGDGSASDGNRSPVRQQSKRREDSRDGERQRRSRTRSRSRQPNNGLESPNYNNGRRESRSRSRESLERETSNRDENNYEGSPVAAN